MNALAARPDPMWVCGHCPPPLSKKRMGRRKERNHVNRLNNRWDRRDTCQSIFPPLLRSGRGAQLHRLRGDSYAGHAVRETVDLRTHRADIFFFRPGRHFPLAKMQAEGVHY